VVRPIDLQDNFSKAPGASKVQQAQQANPEMAHRNTAAAMAQQQIVDQSRTQPGEEADGAELNPEDSGRDQGSERHSAKEREKKETQSHPLGPPQGEDSSEIDVVA